MYDSDSYSSLLSLRSRKSSSRKGPSPAAAAAASELAGGDPDMPEHDLEPPKFSRRALERLLYDWKAVKVPNNDPGDL